MWTSVFFCFVFKYISIKRKSYVLSVIAFFSSFKKFYYFSAAIKEETTTTTTTTTNNNNNNNKAGSLDTRIHKVNLNV
jgi:hypothetical protein